MDSAKPNSKEMLPRKRQHFVNARILSTRGYCRREDFVAVSRCQYFVGANILSMSIFLSVFRIKDDYLLLMIVFCVYHDYY